MKWIPIDDVPEEWKDGRVLAAWFHPFTGWVPVLWLGASWRDERMCHLTVQPTHLMEIVGPK